MPLPFTFSNNTTPTGPQLDAVLNALGAFLTVPCTVAGSNTLVLTPAPNTPTIAAYATGLRVTGAFAGTSNAAMTIAVGALAALPAYIDSAAGPVATAGGEGIANCAFTAAYDAALNSGNGGWHLFTTPLSAVGGSLTGTLTLNRIVATSLSAANGSITGPFTLGSLVVVGSASTLVRLISSQATLAFTVVPANTAQNQTAAMTGVQLGDCISVGVTAVPTNAAFSAFVPAAGSVSLRCLNGAVASLAAFTVIARLTATGGTP